MQNHLPLDFSLPRILWKINCFKIYTNITIVTDDNVHFKKGVLTYECWAVRHVEYLLGVHANLVIIIGRKNSILQQNIFNVVDMN